MIMIKLPSLRSLSSNNIRQFLAKLKSETPTYLNVVKDTQKEAVYKKFTDLNNWYTKILGLDEVKLCQDRVMALQEKLLDAQEKRREVGRILSETRKKSNHLQDEIHKVKRQEDLEKFLQLMKDETEVLKLENEITRSFQQCDQTERELFSAFTNAVRDSHEKQRAQLEYTKYFGIILSITGSFLAFCYTTYRKNDLKDFIDERLSSYLSRIPPPQKTIVQSDTGGLTRLIHSVQDNVQRSTKEEIERREKQVLYLIGGVAGTLLLLLMIANK